MKVLLLNLYYPPDTSATAKMAAAFIEPLAQKHNVTVICGRPSYDPTERRSWRFWQTERLNKVHVVRVGSTDYPRTRMRRRVFNYLSYVALSVPKSLLEPCDVVLAMTDPPFEGIVGAFVAMLKRRPFIYNIRDMYPDMAVGGSIVKPGLMACVWENLHRWALRRATRVMVLGEDMKSRIAAKGVAPARIDIVRDGAETAPSPIAAPNFDADVIGAIRGDFRFVLVHAGNLGFYGAWETLLAAARELQNDGVGLVFVGDGAQRSRLQALATDSPNVRFLPFFPSSKVSSVLAAADAHVITIKRGLEGVVVPSKMYGILVAGRPIVAVAPRETDAATLGEREDFGCAADPDRPKEVVAAVRALLADPSRLAAMGASARAAAPRYARSAEIEKFATILEAAVQR
ncbi:MAG TPA: glycosyltransferase family 4 protein [Candidatus Sulfotelmatobacter sp.]|nr:glycosyltransferase family 4 protein [Candidatus Sulfotelmatobacter sp.]